MNMDKEKLTSEVISAIKQLVDSLQNAQTSDKSSDVKIGPEVVISDLGLESLEILALIDVLERKFSIGYLEVGMVQNLTVGELCRKVVWHQCRIEVKGKLIKLLRDMGVKTDYSKMLEEERIFWDWGFDSMDVEELTCEIEHCFDIDLSGCNLSDYTFGELIYCIAERV